MINKLDTRIKLKRDTCLNWSNKSTFIPLSGEIIIYTDYTPDYLLDEQGRYVLDSEGNKIPKTNDKGEIKYIPGIKIGDGKAYLSDLPFVDEDTRYILNKHIRDYDLHLRLGERPFWDNKIDVIDGFYDGQDYEWEDSEGQGNLLNEMLVLTREDWLYELDRERVKRANEV